MLQILWQAVHENLAENLAGCALKACAEILSCRLCDGFARSKTEVQERIVAAAHQKRQ